MGETTTQQDSQSALQSALGRGRETNAEVSLAEGHSGLEILYQLVVQAIEKFPDSFSALQPLPGSSAFRSKYPILLTEFELARVASAARTEIARFMSEQLREYITWSDGQQVQPLHQALTQPGEALRLQTHTFPGVPGWVPDLVYKGSRYRGPELAALAEDLAHRGMISAAAADAIQSLVRQLPQDGGLNLQGRKIAVLGAGAEMAPTRLWLEAGAQVLWLDMQPPPAEWFDSESISGELVWAADNVDLLTQPQAVLATLIDFADGQPLDLGLYAYAPGRAREVRLTATMNALVDALPGELLGSVTMLVSPTTPTALDEQDRQRMTDRKQTRPLWEAVCDGMGLLGRGGGALESPTSAVTRTVVSIQGGSYQAAQYLGKVLMAETWAQTGQLGVREPAPLRVSANTAAITRTRSLAHPVFTAAFGGAAAMGVETMTPRQSRRLNGLLAVHDWLKPELPQPGRVRVHGGIHTLPYPLESALRIAAGIGFARAPRLLAGLVRRS